MKNKNRLFNQAFICIFEYLNLYLRIIAAVLGDVSMDLKKEMVIIDDQIVTNDISYCKYDDLKNIYVIRYKHSNKFYHFSESRVQYITESTLLNLSDYNFYFNDKILEKMK